MAVLACSPAPKLYGFDRGHAADPNIDIVLLQEALPREPGSARGENTIQMATNYAATQRQRSRSPS